MWSLLLLAQGGGLSNDPLRSPEVIWGTAALALALLVGALVVHLVDRWRKQSALIHFPDAGKKDASLELTVFREMYERGEITEEEYAKLRSRVAERMKTAPSPVSFVVGDVRDECGRVAERRKPAPAPASPAGTVGQSAPPGADTNAPSRPVGIDQPTPPPNQGSPENPPPPDQGSPENPPPPA